MSCRRGVFLIRLLYMTHILKRNLCKAQDEKYVTCTTPRWGELCPNEERLNIIQQHATRSIRSDFTKLQNVISDIEDRINDSSERNRRTARNLNLKEHLRSMNVGSRILRTKVSDVESVINEVAFVTSRADNTMHATESLATKAEMKMTSLENNCARTVVRRRNEIMEQKSGCKISTISGKDCAEIHRKGARKNGIYFILPEGVAKPIQVYCDMQDKGGGWTVIQNRFDGSVSFDRDWQSYKWGFGQQDCNQESEYWIGNEFIHKLSTQNTTEMKIDLTSWDDVERYALYKFFRVGDESTNYKLRVNGYFMDPNGGIGDALDGSGISCKNLSAINISQTRHKLMEFTTKDKDNDRHHGNCAARSRGGWWYNHCVSANLNGRRRSGNDLPHLANGDTDGMVWITWKGCWESLKATKMKIRPFGFIPDVAPINPTDAETRRLLLNRSRIARRLLLRKRWKRHHAQNDYLQKPYVNVKRINWRPR